MQCHGVNMLSRESLVNLGKAAAFLLIGVFLYARLDFAMAPAKGACIRSLYALEDNSIDVLFVGTSYVRCGVDPSVMWSEAGIPCFMLSSGNQFVYASYYYLVEALKTQRPKLVVMDISTILEQNPFPNERQLSFSNLGWRFSINRFRFMNASFASLLSKEWANYMLGLPLYHEHYGELWRKSAPQNYGFRRLDRIRPAHSYTYKSKIVPLQKPLNYARKIVDLLAQRGIELLFWTVPHPADTVRSHSYNEFVESMRGQGVPFLSGSELGKEMGIDYTTDMHDGSHLNVRGAKKVSVYMARYLADRYALPDRRKERRYEEWNEWAKEFKVRTQRLFLKTNPEEDAF